MAKNIIKALALAAGLSILSLGCQDDCEDGDRPHFSRDSTYAAMEILEERIIDLNGVLDATGCCIELSLNNDPSPFVVDQFLESEGYKLRVVAPDRYVPGFSRDLIAMNPCGEAEMSLTLSVNYGCEEIQNPFVDSDGTYLGKVISTRYIQATGIFVEPGILVKIRAEGTVCWGNSYACEGPGQTPGTWGLWAKVGEMYIPVGSNAEFTYAGADAAELKFLIPDSDRPTGTIETGDEEHCISRDYKDNSRAFDVAVDFIWPDTG